MLGYRCWSLQQQQAGPPLLKGAYSKTWKAANVKSPICPAVGNDAGIYAYTTPEAATAYLNNRSIFGAVDLGGVLVQHADGTLRGEYAAIRWLLSFDTNLVHSLKKTYQVPVLSLLSLIKPLADESHTYMEVPLSADMYAIVGDPPPLPPTIQVPDGMTADQLLALFKDFTSRRKKQQQAESTKRAALNRLISRYKSEFSDYLGQEGRYAGGRYRATKLLRDAHIDEYKKLIDQYNSGLSQ